MSKAKRTHQKIKKFVEAALENGTVNLNGRTIEVLDESLLSKRQQKKSEEETLKIELTLNEKLVKIPYYYTLANLPVYVESKYMQKYHFNFTNQQLKEMYTTTKIIVDKWHSTFITDEGIVHRTSFFAVAPNANIQNGIPALYRLSITRKENDQKHYTINMHAIAAGKPDGWLFLGRLDNNIEAIIHPVLKNYMTKKFLKQHNAVVTKNFTPHQLKLKSKLKNKPKYYSNFNYCIPFPHMHQPSTKYEVGEYAERNCPKFLRKCASNTFDENVGYMMKIFNISDHPHYRNENEYLLKIIQQEKNTTNINFPPDPQIVVKEIKKMESSNYNEDEVVPVKTLQRQEKQAYCLQRHKSTRRFR